jgi:hypothetical protein
VPIDFFPGANDHVPVADGLPRDNPLTRNKLLQKKSGVDRLRRAAMAYYFCIDKR